MWELGGNEPRVIKITSCEAKRCPICGQYLLKNDDCYVVVCNAITEARNLGLQNVMPHTACWGAFCQNISSDETLAQKLKKHRMPKAKPLSEEQTRCVKAFVYAASRCGFHDSSNTRDNGIRASKRGTSASVVYNPYTKTITYHDKRKEFLFKSLVDREVVAEVYNEMHKFLGDDKRDDFSALKSIAGIIREANKAIES